MPGPPKFPVPLVLAQACSCMAYLCPTLLYCKPLLQQIPRRTNIHNTAFIAFVLGENEFELILTQHSSHAAFNLLQNFFLEIWISQCTPPCSLHPTDLKLLQCKWMTIWKVHSIQQNWDLMSVYFWNFSKDKTAAFVLKPMAQFHEEVSLLFKKN